MNRRISRSNRRSNLCDKLRTKLCGSFVLLFSMFMNIDSLVILLCSYKRYSIFLISFFSLFELLVAIVCANNAGSLINSLFGVQNLISVQGIDFTLSAKDSCGFFCLLNFRESRIASA